MRLWSLELPLRAGCGEQGNESTDQTDKTDLHADLLWMLVVRGVFTDRPEGRRSAIYSNFKMSSSPTDSFSGGDYSADPIGSHQMTRSGDCQRTVPSGNYYCNGPFVLSCADSVVRKASPSFWGTAERGGATMTRAFSACVAGSS